MQQRHPQDPSSPARADRISPCGGASAEGQAKTQGVVQAEELVRPPEEAGADVLEHVCRKGHSMQQLVIIRGEAVQAEPIRLWLAAALTELRELIRCVHASVLLSRRGQGESNPSRQI
jgi:hypothetical protein